MVRYPSTKPFERHVVRIAVVITVLAVSFMTMVLPAATAPLGLRPIFLVQESDQQDAPDANPGDGVCATTAGKCTFRAAIMEANALPGPDTIEFEPATYVLTIREARGQRAGIDPAATGDL